MLTNALRIGYAPLSADHSAPGDSRRFVAYARSRGLIFEAAKPNTRYDLIVVSQLGDLSYWSRYPRSSGKIIFDFIDSYLHVPRNDLKSRLRGTAKYLSGQSSHLELDYVKCLERMCARADAVICATEEQAHAIRPFCDNVHIILDSHEGLFSGAKRDYSCGKTFHIVWEGMGQNAKTLLLLEPVFRTLQKSSSIALHVVSDIKFFRFMKRYWEVDLGDVLRRIGVQTYLYQWNKRSAPAIITNCDLALIPMDLDDPFIAGKPENKLLLLWRLGMPVLTSPTKAYERAMRACGLDMCCRTTADWAAKLELYMSDPDGREDAARKGKAFVEAHYSRTEWLNRWDAAITCALPREPVAHELQLL